MAPTYPGGDLTDPWQTDPFRDDPLASPQDVGGRPEGSLEGAGVVTEGARHGGGRAGFVRCVGPRMFGSFPWDRRFIPSRCLAVPGPSDGPPDS